MTLASLPWYNIHLLAVWFSRILGLITVLASWGATVELLSFGIALDGVYLLLVSLLLLLLETAFIINIYAQILLDEESALWKYWSAVLWLDGWRKGFIYAIMGVMCLIHPVDAWLATVPGTLLLVLSVSYSTCSFASFMRGSATSSNGDAYTSAAWAPDSESGSTSYRRFGGETDVDILCDEVDPSSVSRSI